jgi:hypothetical protein
MVASRRIEGEWYDMYAHHQIVFPLTPGSLEVGAATVSYSLPLTYSFLSREVRHEPQSESFSVEVLPQPNAGRPATFDGAAGSSITLELDSDTGEIAMGEATMIVATVSGRGNVALWPEPRLEWPGGLRVYPEAVDVDLDSRDDGMWGTKKFRYLAVADAFGTHRIAPPEYSYFDLAASEYVTLTAPALEVFTEGVPVAVLDRGDRSRLPLMRPGPFDWAAGAGGLVPVWGWIAIAILFPVMTLGVRRLRAHPVRRRETGPPKGSLPDLMGAELHEVLMRLVEEPQLLDGKRLADALRAAGVEGPVAVHAARVRDRLWQASYGPEGEIDPEELGAEVGEVLRALTGRRPEMVSVGVQGMTVLALLLLSAGPAGAQSAERLYEAGALKEASDSFRVRVAAEPGVSAHWYNLGSALYGRGMEVEARSTWLKAIRLDPRDPRIRNAVELEAGQMSGDVPWVSPITPLEAFVIAGVLWAIAWILVGVRTRKRIFVPLACAALVFMGYGGYVSMAYGRNIALVAIDNAPLRVAPYGPAPVVRELLSGSTVIVRNTRPGWILVERRGDLGWLKIDEVAPL